MSKEYAVNFAGVRYDFAGEENIWENRTPMMTFYVAKGSLTNGSSQAVKAAGDKEQFIAQGKTPVPFPADQELEFTSGLKVMWVGMRPENAAHHKTVACRISGTRGKLISDSSMTIDWDSNALRVVCPFDKITASYYALYDYNDDGICKGVQVENSTVFFFPEFRKDEECSSLQKRNSSISLAVRQAINAKPKNQAKPLGNDEECEEMSVQFKDMLAGELALDDASASDVKKNIEHMWPVLISHNIEPEELIQLSHAMNEIGLEVGLRYGLAFLVQAIRYMRREAEKRSLESDHEYMDEDGYMQSGTNSASEEESLHKALWEIQEDAQIIREYQ